MLCGALVRGLWHELKIGECCQRKMDDLGDYSFFSGYTWLHLPQEIWALTGNLGREAPRGDGRKKRGTGRPNEAKREQKEGKRRGKESEKKNKRKGRRKRSLKVLFMCYCWEKENLVFTSPPEAGKNGVFLQPAAGEKKFGVFFAPHRKSEISQLVVST